MATFYVDYEGGNNANNGTTFALRKKTIQSVTPAAGDTIRVMASKGAGSLGINATWTNKSATVTLASALNTLIDDGEAAWTASANVTSTADATVFRTGTKAAKHVIAGAFTTGLVAFFATGTLNLSAFQGVTFWFRSDAALAASTLSIRLCSDAAGVTTVDTIAIPAISVAGCWVPIYVDLAGALGASIASVALYADLDPGAVTVYLDNISSVKASSGTDNLNLTSVISKNTTDEGWWAIRKISGTTITLDQSPRMATSDPSRGYSGVTATVTTYKSDTTQTIGDLTITTTTVIQQSITAGTAGNLVTISGGWNRTDMSTQTGETWFDGMNGYGYGYFFNTKNYQKIDKVNFVRYHVGLQTTSTGSQIGTCYIAAPTDMGLYSYTASDFVYGTVIVTQGGIASFSSVGINLYVNTGSARSTATKLLVYGFGTASFIYGATFAGCENLEIGTLVASNCSNHGFFCGNGSGMFMINIETLTCNDNGGSGVTHSTSEAIVGCTFGDVTCNANGTYGFVIDTSTWGNLRMRSITVQTNSSGGLFAGQTRGPVLIGRLTSTGNGSAPILCDILTNDITILNSTMAEATKVANVSSGSRAYHGRLILRNYNATVDDHRIFWSGGTSIGKLVSATDQRHTASGIAWKFSPLAVNVLAGSPLRQPVGRVACASTGLVTLALWVRRDSTSITVKFVVKGQQIGGLTTDQTATAAAAANTWEQLTVTFTPTETGTVEAHVEVYGGTTLNAWIDDFSASQA